jgi:hypothetical protein
MVLFSQLIDPRSDIFLKAGGLLFCHLTRQAYLKVTI